MTLECADKSMCRCNNGESSKSQKNPQHTSHHHKLPWLSIHPVLTTHRMARKHVIARGSANPVEIWVNAYSLLAGTERRSTQTRRRRARSCAYRCCGCVLCARFSRRRRRRIFQPLRKDQGYSSPCRLFSLAIGVR